MITVRISETRENGLKWETTHDTDREAAALDLAITENFGKRAVLHVDDDSGSRIFGQIFKPFGGNQYSSVTKKIYIDMEEINHETM